MSTAPLVAIAMPCLNERRHIEACLESVLHQDYPRDRLEILIADGGSTDGTRAILERRMAEDPRIRVIDNPDRRQATGLNAILRASRGEIIVRMDVHCAYAPDYVRKCVEILERTGADNVGGAQRARAETWFQRALCAALESPLGMGGARYRSAENEGFVDTVFLGAFRRDVFETVGLYDARAITNEDAELNQRILDRGGKIYLSREIVVHYAPRTSYRALARQYFAYGTGRARSLLKHRGLPAIRPVVPFLMVAGGVLLGVTPPLQPLAPLAVGLYAALTGVEAVRVGWRAGLSVVPLAWGVFPVMHVSHGVGFAAGLVRHALHPDWTEPERLDALDAGDARPGRDEGALQPVA